MFSAVDGNQLARQYKDHLSDFSDWSQRKHAKDWLIFPQNIGTHLSIDETSLSDGELYTIVTNKAAGGRKGAIVAIIAGVQSEKIIKVLNRIPMKYRKIVREVTLDMAWSMHRIVTHSFPCAVRVIDRFHVQKLAYDALQDLRISYRWQAFDEENENIVKAKQSGEDYTPEQFENGDTKKQLLARSRYILFKASHNWSNSQKARAKVLFEQYPDIKKAYDLTHSLRMIYSKNTVKDAARTSLAHWYKDVEEAGFKTFNTVLKTMSNHYEDILNFFNKRSTNASAESFNAKIKAFRNSLRGVIDVEFFLFRLTKIYA
jgi:transposase